MQKIITAGVIAFSVTAAIVLVLYEAVESSRSVEP